MRGIHRVYIPWKHDLVYIHMTNQNIAGDFSYIFQKTQIQIGVLQPSQLQVAIDVSAIIVTIS